MKPETEKWLKLAGEDMKMSHAAWDLDIYAACVSHCEQAVEKVLKAGLVDKGVVFRKTHDLLELVQMLGLKLDADKMDFLAKLTDQYLPSRYGDVYVEYSREVAENYFESAKDLYQWLLRELT